MSSNVGWVPSLPSNLQSQLNNLERSTVVGTSVGQGVSALEQTMIEEAMPIVNQQASYQTQLTNLTSLQSALKSLQSSLQTLGTSSTWTPVTATASDSTVMSVSASAGAPSTNVSVTVNHLAQGQISVSSDFLTNSSASAATNIGVSTLTLSSGLLGQDTTTTPPTNKTTTVSIQQGASLNDIASAVNAVSSSTGVQASVVNDGSTGQYELMFTSNQTGQSNGWFSIDGFSISGTSHSIYSSSSQGTQPPSGGTTQIVQSAQDAQIVLGSSGGGGVTMNSSSNTFENVLPDTTITVSQTGTSNLSIQPNPSAINSAVSSFMSSYNALEKLVYTGGSAANTSLGEEIANMLPNLINQQISNGTSQYTSLSQLGIVTAPGGFSISNGTFSSSSPPALEWQPADGITGNLPSGVTMQDGSTEFTSAVSSSDFSNIQQLFGVTSNGLNLPSNSILGTLNGQINIWLNDLGGSTTDTTKTTGEIAQVNNYLSSTGPLQSQLNLLNQQYQGQVQVLLNQWGAAQSSMLQAEQQSTLMQSIIASSQTTAYQTSSMLG